MKEILIAFDENNVGHMVNEEDFFDMEHPGEALKKAYDRGRRDAIEEIRKLKQHSGQNVFCTKEYCPYHEDVDCHDCTDAILNYAEKAGEKE